MSALATPDEGHEVLLFASYCGTDNPRCSDHRPCPICLGMSNVFRIYPDGRQVYVRELAPEWNTSGEVMPPYEVAEAIAKAVQPRKPVAPFRRAQTKEQALHWAAKVARSLFPRPQ